MGILNDLRWLWLILSFYFSSASSWHDFRRKYTTQKYKVDHDNQQIANTNKEREVQYLDQRESNILTCQMCLLGQLLHLTACPLSLTDCLLSSKSREPGPACCPRCCDLCLLRGRQAICSSSAGCIFRSAQPSQWSPDFPESGAHTAIFLQHTKFSKALGRKQFLLTLSMPVCLSTAAASFAGLSSISFPSACVSTMTYRIARDIFGM